LDSDNDGFGSDTKVACDGVTNSNDCNDNLVTYADMIKMAMEVRLKLLAMGYQYYDANDTDGKQQVYVCHKGSTQVVMQTLFKLT
jgi:hypothetical protein